MVANLNTNDFIKEGSGITFSIVNGVITIASSGGGGGLQSGTAAGIDTYTVTIGTVASYTAGDAYVVKFTSANTGASTININSLGAKSLTKSVSTALAGGDILAGQEFVIVYDGTRFQVIGISSGGGGGDMTKAVYDTDNDGSVDKAETVQIIVRNSTGATLTKGQIVYLSGATGNRPNAVLSKADAEATSSKTIGWVTADIANNADGYIGVSGSQHNLDTSAFADGDALWLSAATAGAMTATMPTQPNHAVFIGYVARAHPTLGRIIYLIKNGYELQELHNVLITSVANNDGLFYESSTSLWKNKTIATVLGYTPLSPSEISDTAYAGSWNGVTTIAPSKNAVYDKIETIVTALSTDKPVTFDGQGSVVLVNTRTYFRIVNAGTITGWSIVAEGISPTCTIDIWKIASGTALPTVANTITASAKPALSTGNAVKSTTLTGWTTAIAVDDILCVNVDACSAATKIQFTLYR
tara:strand:+ start:715 stop:2127 length:1413 start_codon:yes stop_codon:yes gene_type:complete